jgi:hypothetical protein
MYPGSARVSRRRCAPLAAAVLLAFPPVLALGALPCFSQVEASRGEIREQESNEYRIKAGFLLNFVKYTTWPKEAFASESSDLVVAVVGKDPFGQDLDRTLAGKTIGKHAISVRRVQKAEDALSAHVLFVGGMEAGERSALLGRVAGRAILVVGEVPGLAVEGSIANFYLENNKVRFEINVEAAKRGKLELSSELLKLARLVKADKR